VVNVVSVPCPNTNKVDEFGRVGNYLTTCAVYHSQQVYDCDNSKTFNNIDSAELFYNRAKKLEPIKYSDGFQIFRDGSLMDVKIDSVFVDKK